MLIITHYFKCLAGQKIEFITAGGRTTAYVPQLQKLTGMQSSKVVIANPEQVAENDDAKEIDTDPEDADNLNTKKRGATSRVARGKQKRDAIGALSRKTRKNGGGKEKPGSDYSEDDGETAEPNKVSTSSKGEKADPVRRSSRTASKPRQVNKLKER
jgi:formamidopyrimidine-DNA glycosylase